MTVPTIQRMSRVSVPAIGESTLGPIRLQGRQLRDGLGRTEYWVHDLAHGDCRGSARVSFDRHRDDHLHGGRRALRGSSDFGSTHCARAGHVHGSRSCSLSSIVPPTFESSPWRHTAWTTCRHGRARLSGGTAEAAGRRCPGSAPLDISMCFTSPEQPVQSGSSDRRAACKSAQRLPRSAAFPRASILQVAGLRGSPGRRGCLLRPQRAVSAFRG